MYLFYSNCVLFSMINKIRRREGKWESGKKEGEGERARERGRERERERKRKRKGVRGKVGGRWDRLKTKYASFFKLYCQNKFLPALKLQSPKPIRPHEKTTSYI